MIALMQAKEGARVALMAHTAAEIEAVAQTIAAEGGTARPYPLDIVDGDEVMRAFAATDSDLGPVSLRVNNAGAFSAYGPIWTVDPGDWRREVETNLFETFNCCRAALPGMIARGRGRVIVMTGGGTARSFPMGSGYATSKARLLRLVECVADTLVGTGVLVFAMDRGLVPTAMTERQLESESGRTYLPDIARLCERGIDVAPTLAARLSVEIGAGRFDRFAGRMLMAARGDLDLDEAAIEIVASDLRSLRVNGMPPEPSERPTMPSPPAADALCAAASGPTKGKAS